jgi:glutathione S-transferase
MARITAMAKGIADRIEFVNARTEQAEYETLNPLNKVPALVTDDGEVLIESRLICQYLDGLAGEPRLYPVEPAARRRVLQREALIHGVLDAVILRFNGGACYSAKP